MQVSSATGVTGNPPVFSTDLKSLLWEILSIDERNYSELSCSHQPILTYQLMDIHAHKCVYILEIYMYRYTHIYA